MLWPVLSLQKQATIGNIVLLGRRADDGGEFATSCTFRTGDFIFCYDTLSRLINSSIASRSAPAGLFTANTAGGFANAAVE